MQPDSHSRAPSRLPVIALALITVLGLARLAFLAFDAPNLSFDEAQYWAWAQTIQLGYYSKPPMVAWAIAATTALTLALSSSVRNAAVDKSPSDRTRSG